MNWETEETELLRKKFSVIEDETLGTLLKRSPNAIRLKALRMGLIKPSTILRKELTITPIQDQLLIGGLLGDLSCRKKKTSRHACLEGGHSFKQKEYLLWKLNFFPQFGWKVRQSKINTFLFQSKSFVALDEYLSLFYSTGKKIINLSILERLSEFGLLIWYLDDGHYRADHCITLHTNGFSLQEQRIIQTWFKNKHEISSKISEHRERKRYPGRVWYFIHFDRMNAKKLLSLFDGIEVPSCMHYKLGI